MRRVSSNRTTLCLLFTILVAASACSRATPTGPGGVGHITVDRSSTALTSSDSGGAAAELSCAGADAPVLSGAAVGTSIALRWQPPQDCDPDSYIISAGTLAGGEDLARVSVSATSTSYSVTSVPPGRYHIAIRGSENGLLGAFSNVVTVVVAPNPSASTWTGLVSNGEGLVINEPECGGGSTMLADVTIAVVQSGSGAAGFVSLVIRSAPGCSDAVGSTDASPLEITITGPSSFSGTIGTGPQDRGTLRGTFANDRISGSMTFDDGATATFSATRR